MFDEKADQAAKEMQDLAKELGLAKEAHNSASIEESHAGNRATDALNRLNTAQQKMDAWLAAQKKDAPHDSDWARDKRREARE